MPPLKYDVVVQPDLALLRNLIKRTVPTAKVDVPPGVGNVIILSGYVTSPQDADIITRLANASVGGSASNVINAVQVGGVQQVQIDVVIASVDRNHDSRPAGSTSPLPAATGRRSAASSAACSAPDGRLAAPRRSAPSANLQLGDSADPVLRGSPGLADTKVSRSSSPSRES